MEITKIADKIEDVIFKNVDLSDGPKELEATMINITEELKRRWLLKNLVGKSGKDHVFNAEICCLENDSSYIHIKDEDGDGQYFKLNDWKHGNCKVKVIVVPV